MSIRELIIAATLRTSVGDEADLALRLSTGLLIAIAVALVGIWTTGMFGIVDETINFSSF
jgi:hypothetical protein